MLRRGGRGVSGRTRPVIAASVQPAGGRPGGRLFGLGFQLSVVIFDELQDLA